VSSKKEPHGSVFCDVVVIVTASVRVLAGQSWTALQVVSALAYAATVFLVGESAVALGGGRWARVLAQLMAATAPVYLALFSVYSMNPLNVLEWALCTRLAIGLLDTSRPSDWIVLGAAVGLGLLNKVDLALFAAGLALGVLLMRRWRILRTRELSIGLLLMVAMFAPDVVWQLAHVTAAPLLDHPLYARCSQLQRSRSGSRLLSPSRCSALTPPLHTKRGLGSSRAPKKCESLAGSRSLSQTWMAGARWPKASPPQRRLLAVREQPHSLGGAQLERATEYVHARRSERHTGQSSE
jgi:hypothetical protein